jgi:hypothetical protein
MAQRLGILSKEEDFAQPVHIVAKGDQAGQVPGRFLYTRRGQSHGRAEDFVEGAMWEGRPEGPVADFEQDRPPS